MTTIVNNPTPQKESGGILGLVIGIIVIGVSLYAFVLFGIPALRRTISVPTPEINIPEKIDINVNQQSQ